MNLRLLLAPFILFTASALAAPRADEDPIAAQLLKDKEAFVAAQGKAKEDVLKAFDKNYEIVKNNKALKIEVQLAQLEKIEAEKKAFDDSGVPPTLTGMKIALSEYRTAQKKAETTCKAAFEKAAKAYRDKGEIKTAGAVLDEMKEFLAKGPAASTGTAVVFFSARSGKVLGLQNGATADGTKIVTAEYAKGDQTQMWKVVPAADGWSYIENVKTGTVMAVNGKGNGAEGHIEKKKDGDSGQLWKLAPNGTQKGVVKFVTKLAPDKVLAITQNSKNAGVRMILWEDNDTGNHGFTPTPPK